jgi:hypothetical protein
MGRAAGAVRVRGLLPVWIEENRAIIPLTWPYQAPMPGPTISIAR